MRLSDQNNELRMRTSYKGGITNSKNCINSSAYAEIFLQRRKYTEDSAEFTVYWGKHAVMSALFCIFPIVGIFAFAPIKASYLVQFAFIVNCKSAKLTQNSHTHGNV